MPDPANAEALRIGRDGVEIRGRDVIVCSVLLLFASGLGWAFWTHLQDDKEEKRTITERVEGLQSDHTLLRQSVDANTAATQAVADQVELSNWIYLATEQEEKRARAMIGTPKLLRGGR